MSAPWPEGLYDRIERARWWLLQEQPCYGALAMRLEDKWVPTMPTAATDGRTIMWGAAAPTWSSDEVRAVVLHETLHCAHQHLWRLPHTARANMAADYVINLIIAGISGCKLPHGALLDSQWSGLSEEEVLARLPENAADSGAAYEDTAGGWAAADDSTDGAGSPQDLSAQWAQAVQQAAALGARQGQLAGSIGRLAAVQGVRRIDWRAALAGFLTAPLTDRADWSRTSRRAAGRGYIVPRHRTEQALVHMAVVRDTSGSISDADLGRCNAVIEAVMAQHPGLAVTLLDCDVRVHTQITLCPGDKVPAHAQGGGGTDFRPAFTVIDALVADEMHIGGVVYITDLAGTFPAAAPAYPVLWVTAEDNAAVPFGSVVTIN